MRKIIDNLRNQPHHVRKSILHALTIAFGIILVLLWVYSLGTNIANPEVRKNFSDNLKPFYILKDNIANGYNSLSNEISAPATLSPENSNPEETPNPGYPSY